MNVRKVAEGFEAMGSECSCSVFDGGSIVLRLESHVNGITYVVNTSITGLDYAVFDGAEGLFVVAKYTKMLKQLDEMLAANRWRNSEND